MLLERGESSLFFFWFEGIAEAMPSSSARVSASDAGNRMFAAHSPERSMASAPGDIRGLMPGFSEETPKHAFFAAAVAAVAAAATLPVSLAGDIGKRLAPLALRRRTIRFAGGVGDDGICKSERHAARLTCLSIACVRLDRVSVILCNTSFLLRHLAQQQSVFFLLH